MFPTAKILAVDDEPNELEPIVGSLRALGLGCIPFRYPDDIQHANSFRGVRVLFLDINLVGGSSPGSGAARFGAPIRVIRQLIDDENGPYALITWSSTGDHDELVARIGQTSFLAGKLPFYSCAISKSLADRPVALRAEVEKIFTDNPPFGALLDWESRVSRAGETVLHQLQVISSRFQGSSERDKMDQTLSHLAVAAFGTANADKHKFESVNEALLPMLNDALQSQFVAAPPSKLWDGALTKCGSKSALDNASIAELNSAISVDTSPSVKPYRRGAVLEVPKGWLADRMFKSKFGGTVTDLQTNPLKLPAGTNVKWVLIQAQASCDFAQPKVGPVLYLLGAIIPASVKLGSLSESVWKSPAFAPSPALCSDPFRLLILHGIPHPIARSTLKRGKFKVVGRLRDQLLEAIVHTHHSHGSRPGFISFR